MKLYTEEQVREIIERAELNQHLTYGDVLDGIFPIELPSDEEIDKEIEWLDNPLERLNFKAGIRWMRDKIRIQGR
jgi:hypothetical protein